MRNWIFTDSEPIFDMLSEHGLRPAEQAATRHIETSTGDLIRYGGNHLRGHSANLIQEIVHRSRNSVKSFGAVGVHSRPLKVKISFGP